MDAATFLLLIQRKAGGAADIRDPLTAAKDFLATSGETAEGVALREVLRTLETGNGTFREADIWLFSRERLQLIAALIEAEHLDLYSRGEWDEFR